MENIIDKAKKFESEIIILKNNLFSRIKNKFETKHKKEFTVYQENAMLRALENNEHLIFIDYVNCSDAEEWELIKEKYKELRIILKNL